MRKKMDPEDQYQAEQQARLEAVARNEAAAIAFDPRVKTSPSLADLARTLLRLQPGQ
jgi:hypothetical protein